MTLCSKLSDSYTSFRWVIYEHRARSRARGRCHLRIGLLNLWRILSGSAAGGNIPLGSEWPSPPITCFHAWIELRHWLRFRPFFNCVVLPWWLGSIRSNSEAIVWYNTWIRREVWGLLVGTGGGGEGGGGDVWSSFAKPKQWKTIRIQRLYSINGFDLNCPWKQGTSNQLRFFFRIQRHSGRETKASTHICFQFRPEKPARFALFLPPIIYGRVCEV